MARGQDFDGKEIFIIGGSCGLGKEMAKVLASHGANLTIFSRSQPNLDLAKPEIQSCLKNQKTQKVRTHAADMGDPVLADKALASFLPTLPDTLILVAGGTPDDLGFLASPDLTRSNFESCMKNNYYSSLYPSQIILKQWISHDSSTPTPSTINMMNSKPKKTRKLIFINSSASLCPIPGYLPYSAAKAAQRSLAETLRLEVTRYNSAKTKYVVQCVFAHNFVTDTFIREQGNKPPLTKRIEGTDQGPERHITSRFPLASTIAPEIVAGIAEGRNDFAVLDSRLEPQMLWANMVGTSPKRGWGIWDWFLGVMMQWFLVPFLIRPSIEKECEGDAFKK